MHTSHHLSFAVLILTALALVGCDTVPVRQGARFASPENECTLTCDPYDLDGDGYADRCEPSWCGALAPVTCEVGLPVDLDADGCARECVDASSVCGGIAGIACDEDEFCDFALDARCGEADRQGVCRLRPEVCIEIFQPVCGCDGNTYANECKAHEAGVSIARWGACEGVICPAYVPDCGGDEPIDADGDGCFLECPGGTTCLPITSPRPEACTLEYSPVCGCDGHTYGNACAAASAGVSFLHPGECAPR